MQRNTVTSCNSQYRTYHTDFFYEVLGEAHKLPLRIIYTYRPSIKGHVGAMGLAEEPDIPAHVGIWRVYLEEVTPEINVTPLLMRPMLDSLIEEILQYEEGIDG